MKIRVGLVGLGRAWEKRHRSALRALSERFEVRAICEQVAHRAEKAASDFGADTVDGYQALVRRDDIDAILMLSPQWFGSLPIFAACESQKAVYCAAAMDLSSEDATEVRRRVEQAGIAFMVEFPRRLAPATLRLKELIATQLGKPRLLFCHVRLPHATKNGTKNTDGIVMRELTELVDWCHYVVGTPPKTVVANGRPSDNERGGYRMLSVDFTSAVANDESPMAQISCGNYMPDHWLEAPSYRLPTGLQVSCEHGVAFIDLPSTLVWFNEAGRHVESLESETPVGEQLLAQFHRSVTSLLRSTTDLENAHLAIECVLAAEQSRIEGRRVKIDPV